MKTTITLLAATCLSLSLNAQNIVTTNNTNRVGILEEFTGTSCPACPSGHAEMANILSNNPNTVFGVAYSPTNSSLTGPYNGGLDLTQSFPNEFYTNPYYGNGDGRSMPSGHVNRTKYSGSRKSAVGEWSSRLAGITSEASPVNVGLASTYDSGTDVVDVTVEMYFTSDVTDAAYVTVVLMENDIVTTQSGVTGDHTHKHVFRANLQNGQWGEALSGTTNQGDLVTMNFSFDNSSTNYVIDNCDVLAFVSTGTADNSDIITGFQVHAKGGSGSVANVNDIVLNDSDIQLYPNPTGNEVNILLNEKAFGSDITVTSITGAQVYATSYDNVSNNIISLTKADLNLNAGTYFVTVSGENGAVTKKLVIQ